MDREALKKFYQSASANFGAYSKAQQKQSRSQSPTVDVSSVAIDNTAASAAAIEASTTQPVTRPSITTPTTESKAPPIAVEPRPVAAGGVGLHAVRTVHKKKDKGDVVHVASPGYFNFLKQQQELQRHHNRAEETITTLETSRRTQQSELTKLRHQAEELLNEMDACRDWQLHSKYDVQQLIRDSSLALQPTELLEDRPPQLSGITDIGALFNKIKTTFKDAPQFASHALMVEQSIRRIAVLEKALAQGHLDATALSRIPDTVLIQLESVCQLPTVESLVATLEDSIDQSAFLTEEADRKRAEAIQEGEVHIAEKLCYDILQHREDMLRDVLSKAQALEKAIANGVVEKVRRQYVEKANEEFEKVRVRSSKLKTRCEEDLKKMFALREKVEEVEAQTAKKVAEDRERSEAFLRENSKKSEIVFAKMAELETELEVLERERHREVQRRTTEKDKDEHRRTEFAQFCAVVDAHTKPLERTILNMDLTMHGAEVLSELVTNGFRSIGDDLAERERLLRDVKLEAHKQHVEVLRGLMLELGEVCYKKERMIEETDKHIQQAHVQQELLAETFNPNAKKFGDVKKRLLLNRDELETDINELRDRAQTTLEQFRYTEDALAAANVEYVHPVTEQEHHTLAMRVKMLEFRAMVVGHVQGQELLGRLEELREEVNASRSEIEAINASTTGTMSKAMPMIRAATKARRQ